jgi:hypothetical protein
MTARKPARLRLERELQGIMRALDEKLEELHGERVGATLFVFELGRHSGTNLVYISNADREDMIASVKAWLARVEAGMTSDPPGGPGRA